MQKNLRKSLVIGLVSGLSSLQSFQAYAAKELARISNKVITDEEFNKMYNENAKLFPPDRLPTKKDVLRNMVDQEIAVQDAMEKGMHKNDLYIRQTKALLFQAYVNSQLNGEVEKLDVTDDEARSYYKKYPEIRTSHIFVAAPPGITPAQRQLALDKIRKIHAEQIPQIQKGTISFAEVAQRYSEGPAAPMGGDLDYQTRDRLDPAYYEASLKLGSPGKMSGIVQSAIGYHIIKLTATRNWAETDQNYIKRLVFEEKRVKLFENYMAKLRNQAGSKVVVHYDLLNEKK